jgi:hypothetical protein
MNIDDGKKSRAALKSYFVKNAIPTEQQFAQVMDSMLNQRDDGLVKPAGNPLSIEAAGDASSFKKALSFYNSLADADPAWTVSLRPRANPADPQTGRAGLSIDDAAGNSRLAIDASNGRVGIGTVAPAEALDVAGRIKAGALAIGPWPANPGGYGFVGVTTIDQKQAGNYSLLQEFGSGRTFLNSPADIRIRINNVDQMVVLNSGDVGIGTSAPGAKLDVNGAVRAQNLLGHRPFKIETGQSSPSDWQVYSPNGIMVDVNTAAAGFTATPRYVTALHGATTHWATTGGSSVYTPSPTGFRIYVRWSNDNPLTPANAQGMGWYIQWIGIQS